jgi:hypothetical protein
MVHLSVSVEGSTLKMYDGHGYSQSVRLAKCRSLRRGFGSEGAADRPTEFSLEHMDDGTGDCVAYEFRTGSAASREAWFAVLKRQVNKPSLSFA